jgi:hypothetical protein
MSISLFPLLSFNKKKEGAVRMKTCLPREGKGAGNKKLLFSANPNQTETKKKKSKLKKQQLN